MQITDDGILVLREAQDLDRLSALADRLAGTLYNRLPRVVRFFISREGLRAAIDLALTGLTTMGDQR